MKIFEKMSLSQIFIENESTLNPEVFTNVFQMNYEMEN